MDNIIDSAAKIRQNNKKKILNYLLAHDCVSKKEIAFHTNLSPATVSNLSNQLMSDGFISVASFQKSSGGRNAGLLTVLNNHKYYLALRLVDETMTDVALLSFEKEIVKSFLIPVKEKNKQSIYEACTEGVRQCLEYMEGEIEDMIGVGVALPGIVDSGKGMLLNSTISFLEGQAVIRELQERIHYPVTGANESNILALALATQNGRDCILPDTIYIHLDEGLGVGIICNGSLLTGSHNRGGEINHMPLGENDKLCGCGQKGCMETELSITGILADYADAVQNTVSWKEFCRDVKKETPSAVRLIKEKGKLLGKLISVLDAIFDPSAFYLGGRGIDLFDEMYPDMMDEYGARVVIDKTEKVKILPCYEYDKLLLRGCADLAFEQFALQEKE